MKNYEALIRHYWNNNREEILDNSYLNCHVKGLHSIMLSNIEGKRIRLYITEYGNELVNNYNFKDRYGLTIENKITTLGFHAHHCNLTLVVLKGNIYNTILNSNRIYDAPTIDNLLKLNIYEYISKILKGKINFKLLKKDNYYLVENSFKFKKGSSISLNANVIHTIGLSEEKSKSAWLVLEGKEDKNYNPIIYSNQELDKINTQNLYIKPTEVQIYELLKQLM